MRAWITILLFVALLLGSSYADDVADVTTSHHHWDSSTTAWQFINSRGDLTYTAYVLDVLGLSSTLQNWFSGTLLLPTDEAWANYRAGFAMWPDEQGTTNALGPRLLDDYGTFTSFFGALMNYHTLRRAVGTNSLRSLIVDTKHFQAPGFEVPNQYHQLTLVNSKSHKFPKKLKGAANTVTTSTFGRVTIDSVRDEQGKSAAFVSTNNRVAGGGIIQIINAVLQPDDVYPSFTALAAANPQFSDIASVIEWWEQMNEYNGTKYNPPFPWGSPFPTFNWTVVNYTAVPVYDPYLELSKEPSAESAGAADKAAAQAIKPQRTESTLRVFEHMMGTMALPTNAATRFNPYNLSPDTPWRWPRLLQYHFIPAPANFTSLVKWGNNKWEQKHYTTYLGIREFDDDYRLTYGGSGSSLTIAFNPKTSTQTDVRISKDNTAGFKRQMNLQTPGKFFHSTAVLMVPNIKDILDDSIIN